MRLFHVRVGFHKQTHLLLLHVSGVLSFGLSCLLLVTFKRLFISVCFIGNRFRWGIHSTTGLRFCRVSFLSYALMKEPCRPTCLCTRLGTTAHETQVSYKHLVQCLNVCAQVFTSNELCGAKCCLGSSQFSASSEIIPILWNSDVQYHFHSSSQLIPIPIQMNLIQTHPIALFVLNFCF